MEIKWAELTTPNPCSFDQPFGWRFHLESYLPAPVPIDVGIVWVGSAKSNDHDIVLDEFEITGIQPGPNEFTIEHPAPDVTLIPRDELFDTLTVMTITFSIGGQPFLRIAYLVQTGAYGEESDQIRSGQSQAPHMGETVESQKAAILRVLGRNVQAQRPRLTVFDVSNWHGFVKGADGSFTAQVQQEGAAAAAVGGGGDDGAQAAVLRQQQQQQQPQQAAVSAD